MRDQLSRFVYGKVYDKVCDKVIRYPIVQRPLSDNTAQSRDDVGFAGIPAVNSVLASPSLANALRSVPRPWVVDAVRQVLDGCRAQIAANPQAQFQADELAQQAATLVASWSSARLRPLINATGVILHTGLGRAPLAASAAAAVQQVAQQYASVEIDLASGQRGKRDAVAAEFLRDLTGAEAAVVVNNNAAATLLVLATVADVHMDEAPRRNVVVSRGELIEIGDSFRLPQIMTVSGAHLREVGTTNKTRLSDYEGAIDADTAALLKVHTSNYRVVGFTEAVCIESLVDLGSRHCLPVVHDIGSGATASSAAIAGADEPTAESSIAAGADLVLFSGDKLLGGPQAGIILGKKQWIERVEKHPLMRALRVDKLTLAALEATLRLHHEPARATQELPVLAMATASLASLRRRAQEIAATLQAIQVVSEARVADTTAYLGGGAMPQQGIPSIAVRIEAAHLNETQLSQHLRSADPPVIARVQDGAVWLDLRTIFARQDADVVAAVRRALEAG